MILTVEELIYVVIQDVHMSASTLQTWKQVRFELSVCKFHLTLV